MDADYYQVYGGKCGTKIKKLEETKELTYKFNKAKAGKYYKFIVMAVKDGKAVQISKMVHIGTKGGKTGNITSVTLNKKTLKLKVGKSAELKVKEKTTGPVKKHRKMCYESSDKKVKVNVK